MAKRQKHTFSFSLAQIPQLLSWAANNKYFSLFNGNEYSALYGSFDRILFVGKRSSLESNDNSFAKLTQLINNAEDWIYGYFSYDLKNEIEKLESNNQTTIPVNHLGFYVPEIVIQINTNHISIESFDDPENIYNEIIVWKPSNKSTIHKIDKLKSSISKRKYIEHVQKIKSLIVEGEFYEMNYCIEFTANTDSFDPLKSYLQLNELSPMPFSTFMRMDNIFLLCASPERFVKKENEKLISQPIKGTSRRSIDKNEDEVLKAALKNSEKERAENLMIVDLVRNDLAKSAVAGSIKVEELYGIYTFKKIHQMISTVTAIQNPDTPTVDIIKHAFPMGSMTGAPKIRVMEEIEGLEDSARGLYSGSFGYFKPNHDFDFNVVIRSIIYCEETGKISFHVGSAITYDSDPEYEYNECMLKAESMIDVLS